MRENRYLKKGLTLYFAITLLLVFYYTISGASFFNFNFIDELPCNALIGAMTTSSSFPLIVIVNIIYIIKIASVFIGIVLFIKAIINSTDINKAIISLVVFFGISFLEGIYFIFDNSYVGLKTIAENFSAIFNLIILYLFITGKIKTQKLCFVLVVIVSVIPIIIHFQNIASLKYLSITIFIILLIYSVTNEPPKIENLSIFRSYNKLIWYLAVPIVLYLFLCILSIVLYSFSVIVLFFVYIINALFFTLVTYIYSSQDCYKTRNDRTITFKNFQIIVYLFIVIFTCLCNLRLQNFASKLLSTNNLFMVLFIVSVLSAMAGVSEDKGATESERLKHLEADFLTKVKRVLAVSIIINQTTIMILPLLKSVI